MASGDTVVRIICAMPPGKLYETEDIRVGGSTPAEGFPVWDFDDTTDEYMDFLCLLTNYGGGGLTFKLAWAATSATTGDVVWRIAVRAMPDDAEDIDAAHTYDFNSVTAPTASASGEIAYDTITFTNGADMDSWATGEYAIVRVSRQASSGSDTMAGDAELVMIHGSET